MKEFICGDCMNENNGLPTFKDKSADLAIVDPDYGLNEKISIGGTWASKYKKNDGYLGGIPNKEYFAELFRISKNQIIWGGNYFNLPPNRCFIVWHKLQMDGMHTMANVEYAWTNFDKNAKFISMNNTGYKRIHICQKPIALYKWLLYNYAKKGNIILDTHVGSASSLIACEQMGFDYIAYEKDKDYYRDAKKRLQESRMQTDLFKPETKQNSEQMVLI